MTDQRGGNRTAPHVEWGVQAQFFPNGPWSTRPAHSREHAHLIIRDDFRGYPAEAVRLVTRRVTDWRPDDA